MAEQYITVLSRLDESFSLRETRNYGLFIIFSEISFSYCILDLKQNRYLGISHLTRVNVPPAGLLPSSQLSPDVFLGSIFENMPWLKNPFSTIKIAYEGKNSTLIPAMLYNPDEKENFLKFSFKQNEEEQVLVDHLIPMDSYQVFSVPLPVLSAIRLHYPDSRVIHYSSVLIESVWINYKNRIDTTHVFLHLRDRFLDLLIFDGRIMAYYNTFPFQTPEDVTYYLIFVMEQMNLNPETIPLVLLGNTDYETGLSELLVKYIRHLEFGKRNESFRYSYIMNQLPSHAYFPLLNFFSCGL